ncbi:hypothetical protein RBG61_03305 [Paludicola sp. MB14-C6]|uniref:hypothetical protein n=1 Tax=Paludihabitans sp. MB14-C6 TaxID=3070656 RepID=UPI0027DB0C71|nr:hypothetical protein [Paludicola sp. MB14-C6]WMJ23708.1 hypothetical protein RBG61_03305 [Paludicola sp. MB14-C6]
MIDWLNDNQGFIMCLLTLVYVVATIVIVHYNRKSIKEMKTTREAESRPYVFAYLHKDPRDLNFYLHLKNYGKSGAKINSLTITPSLQLCENKNLSEYTQNIILAPSQKLYFILLEKSEETQKSDYHVCLNYSPIHDSSKKYQEDYDLIIQYADLMGYTEPQNSKLSPEGNALRNIASNLDSIRNKL